MSVISFLYENPHPVLYQVCINVDQTNAGSDLRSNSCLSSLHLVDWELEVVEQPENVIEGSSDG